MIPFSKSWANKKLFLLFYIGTYSPIYLIWNALKGVETAGNIIVRPASSGISLNQLGQES
jgi:hypothetical protein